MQGFKRNVYGLASSIARLALFSMALFWSSWPAQAQPSAEPEQSSPGVTSFGARGLAESMADIMGRQKQADLKPRPPRPMKPEFEHERDDLRQNPEAPAVAQWPPREGAAPLLGGVLAPQTLSTNFTAATLSDTGSFPPDTMGAAGPTQYIAFVNGQIRSFTRAGVADGVLNVDPDVFFASVMTPVGGSVVLTFTSDPQIRYDRFTARWFLSIIDVPCTNPTCTATAANRWMLAVSDAASNGTISGATVWTFFQFQADPGTNFCDYPSLGIDVNALYMGGNMFSNAGSFVGTNGYVIQKSSVLGAGPIVKATFANLAAESAPAPSRRAAWTTSTPPRRRAASSASISLPSAPS